MKDDHDQPRRAINGARQAHKAYLDIAMKSILRNPKARRGFTPDEIKQMGTIARGTFTGNAVKWLGNVMGGHLGTLGSIGAAYETGSLAPLAIAPVGYGFKKLGNVLTMKQVGKLDELMQARSPQAQAKIIAPLTCWSNAVQAFETAPVARNLARVSIASRNLANNFQDIGVTVSPQDLVKSIASSTANEQQQ
jgi:hypothetical protein